MTNFEFYKNELINIVAEHICVGKDGKPRVCDSFVCDDCAFFKERDCKKATKEWLLAEHKEKVKLKQWEYDLLEIECDPCFEYDEWSTRLESFIDRGYFKGLNGISLTIREILENCIIVADDYEGFDECK